MLINPAMTLPTHSSIRVDNRSGIRSVIEHLLATGRRRLVHIRGPSENIDAEERCAAFLEIVAKLCPEAETSILKGTFTDESGEAAVQSLLNVGQKFDAIVAANDMMAIGALQALRSSGVNVPQQVAVAGFDDIPLARYVDLTTVRVEIAELGARAIARLVAMLDGGDVQVQHELQVPELIVRATSQQGTTA